MSHLDSHHGFAPGANISPWAKEICSPAFAWSWLLVMLWERFLAARVRAAGETSTPWRWRDGMCGARRE